MLLFNWKIINKVTPAGPTLGARSCFLCSTMTLTAFRLVYACSIDSWQSQIISFLERFLKRVEVRMIQKGLRESGRGLTSSTFP